MTLSRKPRKIEGELPASTAPWRFARLGGGVIMAVSPEHPPYLIDPKKCVVVPFTVTQQDVDEGRHRRPTAEDFGGQWVRGDPNLMTQL